MLQAIRDRATGWIAYVIIILICIPFALWGINSYFGTGGAVDVAEVEGEPISQQDFQQAYQNERARLQNIFGNNFDSSMLDDARIKSDVLQRLIDGAVLEQTLQDQNLRVGDQRLNEEIRTDPRFQENGQFSFERYRGLVSGRGRSEVGYEENLRTGLAARQLNDGLLESTLLTRQELDRMIALLNQQRELSYLLIEVDDYLDKVEVDEAAVKTYFDENKNQFNSPEQVNLQYLELDLERMAAAVEVDDEILRRDYNERIQDYTKPEQRSASHILVALDEEADEGAIAEARARAEAIHSELNSGAKTFDQIMQEAAADEALEAAQLGLILKDTMESSFEEALYGLGEIGQFSAPVRTSFGFHIIRLDDLQPGEVQPFEEVRDNFADAYQKRQAETVFFDQAETLANLSFENPDSLEPAAEALGLQVQETGFFSRDNPGQTKDIRQYPDVLAAAFSPEVLQQGLNSESIEVAPGHVVVVRLAGHKTAEPLSFEQAKEDAEKQLRRKLASDKVQQISEQIEERIGQGAVLADLAEEFSAELKQPGLVGRSDAAIDAPIVTAAFRLAKPAQGEVAAGTVGLNNGDQAVLVVSRVVPGSKEDLERSELDAMVQRLENELGRFQYDAFIRSRRQELDIVTFGDRL